MKHLFIKAGELVAGMYTLYCGFCQWFFCVMRSICSWECGSHFCSSRECQKNFREDLTKVDFMGLEAWIVQP